MAIQTLNNTDSTWDIAAKILESLPFLTGGGGGGGAPTGAAGGALTGTYPNPGVNVGSGLITGILPVANGGTGAAGPFTQGSVIFAGPGGVLSQDNSKFFWDDTLFTLKVMCTGPVKVIMGDGFPAAAGTYGGIGFNINSFNSSNYSLLGDGSDLFLNSNGGSGHIYSQISNVTKMTVSFDGSVGVGVVPVIAGGQFQVTCGSASTIGQVIKLAALQTADAFEVQNSASVVQAKIDKNGSITCGGAATPIFIDGTVIGGFSGFWCTTTNVAAPTGANFTFLGNGSATALNCNPGGVTQLRSGGATALVVSDASTLTVPRVIISYNTTGTDGDTNASLSVIPLNANYNGLTVQNRANQVGYSFQNTTSGGATLVSIGNINGQDTYPAIGLFGALTVNNATFYHGGDNSLVINRPTGGDILMRENNGNQLIIKASTGFVGINIATTPAAQLHVFGTTSAITCVLRMADTTPGDFLRFDNSSGSIFGKTDILGVTSNICGVAGTSTVFAKHGGNIFNHFSDASTTHTDGTEDDLYSDSTPASGLLTNGDKYESDYCVLVVGSATATRRIQAYFGGTKILDSGTLTFASGGNADIWVGVIRESSSVVRVKAEFVPSGITLQPIVTYTRITGLTLTNAQILKITGIATGTGAAAADIVAKLGSVKYFAAA